MRGRRLLSAAARLLDRRVELAGLERLGSDYGGYVVPANALDAASVCYAAGLGEDASFDLALIERFGCEVWAFDPTPRAVAVGEELAAARPGFHFLSVGVWSEAAELKFYAPRDASHVSYSALNVQATKEFFTARAEPLAALMRDLGHERVDLLKLNVEGAEVPALDAALRAGIRPRVLCVAFEHPSRLRVAATKLRLRAAGYALAAREREKHTYVLR